MYVAHTPPPNRPDITTPHTYADHIREAIAYGLVLFDAMLPFCQFSETYKQNLKNTLEQAIALHDLGKLDNQNQAILQGKQTGRLPVDHIEAGVAVTETLQNELLAWIIRGHHAPGLPSKTTERLFAKQFKRQVGAEAGCIFSATALRGKRHKRNSQIQREEFQDHLTAIQHTNTHLELYKNRQQRSCGDYPQTALTLPDQAVLVRFMLSCLVQADHLSTACYAEGKPMPEFTLPPTFWDKRLAKLNTYVEDLGRKAEQSIRNQLRSAFYQRCFSGKLFDDKIASCSAAVGLGKTTAVMSYTNPLNY